MNWKQQEPTFKTRNVIIWHWFIKNLVGTWRRNDVDATSLRRIDVVTTSLLGICPPLPPPPIFKPCPPNILNRPTPMRHSRRVAQYKYWNVNYIARPVNFRR